MPMQPFAPLEPIYAQTPPAGDDWIAQVKWDGVRMLAHVEGSTIRLWNRRQGERTAQYPELLTELEACCRADSAILDGEIIALDHGLPSFHHVMKRDQLRNPAAIPQAVGRIPVAYMVFDLVYLDGQWIGQLPLAERQNRLADILEQTERVRLVPHTTDSGSLLEVMRGQGMEGIVCKRLSSTYPIGGKDSRWQKIKLYRHLYAAVGGITYQDGRPNALLLGLYNEEQQLFYIGNAGPGKLGQAQWSELVQLGKALRADSSPFTHLPRIVIPKRSIVWLQPSLAVLVRFLEWTADGGLRQPVIQSVIENVQTPALCRFGQAVSSQPV